MKCENAVSLALLKRTFYVIVAFCTACAHTAQIRTTPPQAEAFSVDEKGNRLESLGKTPLQTANVGPAVRSIELELPGYLPSQILIPPGPPKNLEFEIVLREFNKSALDSLSPKLYQGAVDKVMQQLLEYQQSLFSGTAEDAEQNIAKNQKTLDGVASFHYITGTYYYFNGKFDEAVKAFSRALSINPEHEQARRMAILTDVKMANQTQAVRSKAFVSLQAAATEVATLSSGYLVRTKSKEWLTDFDGFEMILPSDSLFKPASAKFLKDGQGILGKLAEELKKSESPRTITVEAHTDSDMSAELTRGNGAVLKGKAAFRSVWELSSARAAAVVDYLRNEGGVANTWNIAGYGDSRPLQVASATMPAKAAEGALSRRVVIRVTNLSKELPLPTISPEEAARIKARLEASQAEDENGPDSKRRNSSGSAEPAASSSSKKKSPKTAPSRSSRKNGGNSGSGSASGTPNFSDQIPNADSASDGAATKPSPGRAQPGSAPAAAAKLEKSGDAASPGDDFEKYFDEAPAPRKPPPGQFRPEATAKDVARPKIPKGK